MRCDGCGGTAWGAGSGEFPCGDAPQSEQPPPMEEAPTEERSMEERPMEECCPLFHGLSLGDFDEKHPTPDAPLTPANVREAVIAVANPKLAPSLSPSPI